MPNKLSTVRRDYDSHKLLESDLPEHPMTLVGSWLQTALDQNIPDANAMALATVDAAGFPTSRMILARKIDLHAIHFFTNYQSNKGSELTTSGKASALFFWSSLERQIRLTGVIQKTSTNESDAYFASRPRDSQIAAWASPQSNTLASREELERLYDEATQKFINSPVIARPPYWGGYQIKPVAIEFWQGRTSRLHDRLKASLVDGAWQWQRLAP